MNPGLLQSVRITARHHALSGQVVRVVRRKRHRGEAYVVVEVEDGSRQLIAVRNTELADALPSAPDLRFTPGSLRALLDVIEDRRGRAERENGTAAASADAQSGGGPADLGIAPTGHAATGRAALDRTGEASTIPVRARRRRSTRQP